MNVTGGAAVLAVELGEGLGDRVGVAAEVGVDGIGNDGAAVTADGLAGSVVEGGRDEVEGPAGEQAASIEARSSPIRNRRSAIAVISYPGRRG